MTDHDAGKGDKIAEREARLAAQLRANLRRRKAQARGLAAKDRDDATDA